MSQTEAESVEEQRQGNSKSLAHGFREVDPEMPSRFLRVPLVQRLSESSVLREILRFLLEE